MNTFILIFMLLSIISITIVIWRKSLPLSILIVISLIGTILYTGWMVYNSNFSFAHHIHNMIDKSVSLPTSFTKDDRPASKPPVKEKVLLDVPIVKQLPELPRGCEVTSLAMLIQYTGLDADKLKLAQQIKKNPAKMRKINGEIHYGDPNDGFIGDMYSTNKPGLGVYHKPIKKLAEHYMPGKIIDFTNEDFNQIKKYLSTNRPVWVIINTAYEKLDPSYFHTWKTPNGKISITYKEHSVVVTGYDQKYIYFNDPLTGIKNKKAPSADFEKAWVQMGKQAITYKD